MEMGGGSKYTDLGVSTYRFGYGSDFPGRDCPV
jgi:hypothetical protein